MEFKGRGSGVCVCICVCVRFVSSLSADREKGCGGGALVSGGEQKGVAVLVYFKLFVWICFCLVFICNK